jgi:hypothetical protein
MSRYKQNSLLILEQLSAAIDAEDNMPNDIFDKNHELSKTANIMWKNQSIVNIALNKNQGEFTPCNNLKSIMDKVYDIPDDISTKLLDKKYNIRNIIADKINIQNIKQNAKKWLGIIFPIGITAAFMGLSISTHNMELFSSSPRLYSMNNSIQNNSLEDDKRIDMYLNAHQKNDTHAYGLVNIANSEDSEDNYVDNYTFKTIH